jgi:hypothetical protein
MEVRPALMIKTQILYRNPSLPEANPKLELLHSEDRIRGRYVITREDLTEGEVLFR